jgi:hypothetical protein
MSDSNSFGSPEAKEPIRLRAPEGEDTSESSKLVAELGCLVRVDHFEVGGLRDTMGQVTARWREVFQHIPIEVPRPAKGVLRLPLTCPCCGKAVLLQANSWWRTNLLVDLGVVALGLALALLGWFVGGMIGTVFLVAGLVVAIIPPVMTLIAPGALDQLPNSLLILQDVSRDPAMYPAPGKYVFEETTSYSELAKTGSNQHKLGNIRVPKKGTP